MTEMPKLQGSYNAWYFQAEPGDRVIYHIGTHAGGNICREFMDAADAGLVILMRKRVDDTHMFQYIAQKSKLNKFRADQNQ